MDREEVRMQLAVLLAGLLDIDTPVLADEMTAADVAGWDSLAHLKLTMMTETNFGIRFNVHELEPPPTVGAYIDLILAIRARG